MTKSEESAVYSHVLVASGLKMNGKGYSALCQLMRIGHVHYIRLGITDTTELARILIGIGLVCYLTDEGLKLSPTAVSNYYENVMQNQIEKEISYVLLRGSEIKP